MTVPSCQGRSLNIFSGVCPAKILSVTYLFVNGSWSSTLACKNTLYFRFYLEKWQIFKVGGWLISILPIKLCCCQLKTQSGHITHVFCSRFSVSFTNKPSKFLVAYKDTCTKRTPPQTIKQHPEHWSPYSLRKEGNFSFSII